MTSLLNELEKSLTAKIEDVGVDSDFVTFRLNDGRVISFPVTWSPRLLHGTIEERNHWELIGGGFGVHWPNLDEDISLAGVLLGLQSGESKKSFQRWLQQRKETVDSLAG